MTDIEKQALALLQDCGFHGGYIDRKWNENYEALCRAIEQHEAFRREVSDAVEEVAKALGTAHPTWAYLQRFIIAKPDNIAAGLALAVEDTLELVVGDEDVNRLRAALAARGLEIVEVGHD